MKIGLKVFAVILSICPCCQLLASPLGAQTQNQNVNVAGQSPDQATEAPTEVTTTHGSEVAGPDYLVGAEDVLEIEVFNLPELEQEVRVENDGTISVNLLGRVKVAGLTAAEVRQKLESEWGKSYLEQPQVDVFIKQFRARPVSVIGAVEKPGLYYLGGPRNLIEVLSMAGGLAKRGSGAAGRMVYVTRKGGFQALPSVNGMRLVAPDQVEIDLKQLLYSQDNALSIPIQPYDSIRVSKAGVVYVVGEVKKPGGFMLEDRDSFTVLQALALAEGLGPNASRRGARIIHRSSDGSLKDTRIDIGKILRGRSEDVELAANDVLFVPDNRGKVVGRRSADSIIGVLTGLIIFRGGL